MFIYCFPQQKRRDFIFKNTEECVVMGLNIFVWKIDIHIAYKRRGMLSYFLLIFISLECIFDIASVIEMPSESIFTVTMAIVWDVFNGISVFYYRKGS